MQNLPSNTLPAMHCRNCPPTKKVAPLSAAQLKIPASPFPAMFPAGPCGSFLFLSNEIRASDYEGPQLRCNARGERLPGTAS